MNRGIALALIAGAFLGSCGALDPYPTTPRAAQDRPPGAPPVRTPASRVGICYNTMTTTLDEVRRQAQSECPANTVAEADSTDWYLQYCPLLLPSRATFACMKVAAAPAVPVSKPVTKK